MRNVLFNRGWYSSGTYVIGAFILLASCDAEKSTGGNAGRSDAVMHFGISDQSRNIIAAHALFIPHRDVDTFLLGDLNNDRLMDTAIVTSPVYHFEHDDFEWGGGCKEDACITTVHFSTDTAVLRHEPALGFYRFFATHDLNSDGMKEVAFIPQWFQSNWQGLFVYSFQDGGWKQLGSGSVFTSDNEVYETRIRKVSDEKFEIISMRWNDLESEMTDTHQVFTMD